MLVVGSAGALIAWVNSLNSSIGIADERERTELLDALAPASTADDEDNAVYVAILGSDARSGDTVSRSDVVTLVRIDETARRGGPHLHPARHYGEHRGGRARRRSTPPIRSAERQARLAAFPEFARVPINHYVEVHFDELETVVDKLGGIWVDIPESFSAGNGGMSFTEGTQRLNGEQALAFARERYNVSGGDFRTCAGPAPRHHGHRQRGARLVPGDASRPGGGPRPMHFHRLLGERPCSSGHSVPAKRAHHVLGGLPQLQPERRWRQLRRGPSTPNGAR